MKAYKIGDFIVTCEHNYDETIRRFMPIGAIKNSLTGEEGSIIALKTECKAEQDADRLVRNEAKRRIVDNNWQS